MPDAPQPSAPAETPTTPADFDLTIEEGLRSVARHLRNPKFSAETRRLIAEGYVLEYRIVVRAHHNRPGFCLALDRIERKNPVPLMWRTDLQ